MQRRRIIKKAAIEQGDIVRHRTSLECDKRKREQTAGKGWFSAAERVRDVRRERVGGRFVKSLVLQGGSL